MMPRRLLFNLGDRGHVFKSCSIVSFPPRASICPCARTLSVARARSSRRECAQGPPPCPTPTHPAHPPAAPRAASARSPERPRGWALCSARGQRGAARLPRQEVRGFRGFWERGGKGEWGREGRRWGGAAGECAGSAAPSPAPRCLTSVHTGARAQTNPPPCGQGTAMSSPEPSDGKGPMSDEAPSVNSLAHWQRKPVVQPVAAYLSC